MAGGNIDADVVKGFGQEWSAYDQSGLSAAEHQELFDRYFSIFPFDQLPANAVGFDLGCGSGRWARLVAPCVGTLHCIDPAVEAVAVARQNLQSMANVRLHVAAVDEIPLPSESQDFGYSLGVLHHIPDTAAALRSCVEKLKVGAPFLLYLYYHFDNRPRWFRALWRASESGRFVISRLPFPLRRGVATGIAGLIYYPFARTASLVERLGGKVAHFPLSSYRKTSFYTMRTDALDRFGTKLEQRFTRSEMTQLMESAGLKDVRFSEDEPFWVAVGYRAS